MTTTPIEPDRGNPGLAIPDRTQHLSCMRSYVIVPLAAICCLLGGSLSGLAQDTVRSSGQAATQRSGSRTAPGVAQTDAQKPVRVNYAAYAAGLQIAAVDATFQLKPETYRVELAMRTTGVVGWFIQTQTLTTVDGTWRADRPAPHQFLSRGEWRGQPRFSLIDYKQGQPEVRQLIPPNEAEREPVPLDIQANSVDSLSAMAELVHVVGRTGGCEGTTRVFDGRRASDVTARTVGEEIVPPSSRSVFTGPALRCDFEGRMVAGFWLDADRKAGQKPMKGSAWLANPLAGAPSGGPKLPVRITFESRWLGDVSIYLTQATPDQDPRRIVVR